MSELIDAAKAKLPRRKPGQTTSEYMAEHGNLIIIPTEIEQLLKNPRLLDLVRAEFQKKIVGEENNSKALFIIACGKYVENAQTASFNVCINQVSGAGKDFVGRAVVGIFPAGHVEIRTRISPTAFTYWHNARIDPTWTWNGKVCFLSDISDGVLNHEVMKLMMSDGTHSTVVINQMAVDIEINGKPVIFITTASANPKNEMLRRVPFLEVDSGKEQTASINRAQAKAAATGKKIDYDPQIVDALGYLRRVNVLIPYAEKLPDVFPHESVIMRTHFQRLLDYIKASAALHQFQRQRDDDGNILANGDDYDNALIPLRATTSNRLMIPLTVKQKKLLTLIKSLGRCCYADIEVKFPYLGQSALYDYLRNLHENGFLRVESVEVEGKKKPVHYYECLDVEGISIPTWNDISCGKIGINGIGGNNGISGNNGNNQEEPINSNHSVNSGLISTHESDTIIHLPCQFCQAEPSVNWYKSKPICRPCLDLIASEEVVE